jgi:hypothetical protein
VKSKSGDGYRGEEWEVCIDFPCFDDFLSGQIWGYLYRCKCRPIVDYFC